MRAVTLDWSDAGLAARMRQGWSGGLAEGTPCGPGSLLRHSANAREWIPRIMHEHALRTLCDAGAGDGYWMEGMGIQFHYRPFDLVPRNPWVTRLDFTRELLPDCDVVLCRCVLLHLDPPRVHSALALFRVAAPYLIATTEPSDNAFNPARQCNPVDLTAPPYNLGEPLDSVADLEGESARLGLWRLR